MSERDLNLGLSRQLKISWNAIDGIMQRAVKRGLSRRAEVFPKQLGIDETAFKKCHDYVTIISDQESGAVLHVGLDRIVKKRVLNRSIQG